MDEQRRARLLALARQAIRSYLEGDEERRANTAGWPDPTPRGVFVTLRRGERLRGCIGTFAPCGPLPETVWDMAVAAARDPRFAERPVTLEELPHLTIEISVLSELERTTDPLALEVGRHGVYVRSAEGSGCYLPSVAVECGWGAEEFLSACCRDKARLKEDAWKDPRTEVYLFTVEKFGDDEAGTRADAPAPEKKR